MVRFGLHLRGTGKDEAMRRNGLLILAVGAVLAAGVGGANGAAIADASPSGVAIESAPARRPISKSALTRVDLVVIGDSLTGLSEEKCHAECWGFVQEYMHFLRDTFGVDTYSYTNIPAAGVADAVQFVTEVDRWRQVIADAEVVVVETGFHDALPDPASGIGCGGAFSIDWILSTRPDCLEQGVATYGQLYDQVFAAINELRAGQPSVLIATTTINGHIDVSIPDGLLALAGDRADQVKAWVVAAYDRWNTMLTERAEAAGFAVVDLYHAFNGPDGSQPPGVLWGDGDSPSSAGHDLITAMLADVELTPLLGG
jgi:hypothetical protein